jgi:hypothetical protein
MSIKIGNIDFAKQKVVDLKNDLVEINRQYVLNTAKLDTQRKFKVITEEEHTKYSQQLDQKHNNDVKNLEKEIEQTSKVYSSKVKDEYKDIKKSTQNLTNSSRRKKLKLSRLKTLSTSKLGKILKIAAVPVLATTSMTVLMNTLSLKNKKISDMVDDTNELIDKANESQNPEDIKIAINSINSTLRAIQDSQKKIDQVQGKIRMYSTTLTIASIVAKALKLSLDLLFSSPAPSKPLAVTILYKIDALLDTVFSLNLLIGIIVPSLLNNLILELEEQKQRIKQLELQGKENDVTSGNTSSNNLSNLNNIISSTSITNNSSDLNNSTLLGEIPNIEYKGFRFVIKEENNPNFVVSGIKRRYAVIINSNNREILTTEPSFTLQSETLIEELKIEIDRRGLTN